MECRLQENVVRNENKVVACSQDAAIYEVPGVKRYNIVTNLHQRVFSVEYISN